MPQKEKVNVLMVDDQPAKLLTYEVILADLGENLLKATSGAEALQLLLKNEVAVVLTDVSMPAMDGFELADTIRQHPRFQQLPIIFISGVFVSDLDRLRGYKTGAVDYISVPIIPELLRAKVSVFAELHRRAQQLEALNRELRRLSNSLITAQDQERRRIARSLHDGLGQELSAAKMVLDGIVSHPDLPESRKNAAAVDASSMLERALLQVRSISHLLHPPMLDEVGLISAITWFLGGFSKRSGIETALDLQPRDFPRFTSELETAVFRLVQEALNNVFRHSGARSSWVGLQHQRGKLIITVRDDGKGLNRNVLECRADSIGVGISGMRQRVKEFGGEFRLQNSHPGTLVEISIPSAPFLATQESAQLPEEKIIAEQPIASDPGVAASTLPVRPSVSPAVVEPSPAITSVPVPAGPNDASNAPLIGGRSLIPSL